MWLLIALWSVVCFAACVVRMSLGLVDFVFRVIAWFTV